MRVHLLWAVVLLALVAAGARVLTRGAEAPSEADVERAQALLNPASLPAAENERRLVLYNSLRDRMDASEFGVLEAVAGELRDAPGNRVSRGFDLRTFYSAVGGDLDFRGGGQEDWPRLLAFQEAWLQAVPESVAARVARAQTRLVGMDDPEAALADLREAGRRQVADAHLWVLGNRVLDGACQNRQRALAREAFDVLGERALGELLSHREWAYESPR